jgi:uroporphyrinogen III methyltransferase / synthase
MNNSVYLVGAGCGDETLITVKGKRAIEKADVIIYDYLANDRLLRYNKKDAELIYVGKQANNHAMAQADINALIVEKAQNNVCVVRLKGGDPYVFGRGGEEGQALFEANIDFDVVPGITSAIGGIAYAGIPITHRGVATSFHVITGHRKAGGGVLDFELYAKLNGTLVFLMGIGNLENIVGGLMSHGMDKAMPVAIVENASRTFQRTTVGILSDICKKAEQADVKSPGLIVVGKVVEKREALNFFENKPLFGKTVVVTRARAQASALVEKIEDLGGEAIEMPVIAIEKQDCKDLTKQIENLSGYQYTIFTSANAVDIFFETLFSLNKDARAFKSCKIVAVGSATNCALKHYGIVADFVPDRFVAESVFDLLKDKVKKTDRVLLPTSKNARNFLAKSLSKICEVNRVDIYKTVKVKNDYSETITAIENKQIDYITFTSSSTVKNVVDVIGIERLHILDRVKLISIGPITSKTMDAYGLKNYKQASEYTIDGIIKELENDQ